MDRLSQMELELTTWAAVGKTSLRRASSAGNGIAALNRPIQTPPFSDHSLEREFIICHDEPVKFLESTNNAQSEQDKVDSY